MRATYIEFIMTIFEQCHNVLNNNGGREICNIIGGCFISDKLAKKTRARMEI